MMQTNKFKILILTDHSGHSSENSLYPLAADMLAHKEVEAVDVASRANSNNVSFFNMAFDSQLSVTRVNSDFSYAVENHPLDNNHLLVDKNDYNFIWLRLPPPLPEKFLQFIELFFADKVILNNPKGIFKTGSKEFLLNFRDVCPPIKLCHSIQDIVTFSESFPIVLKPLREYGGSGIIKIDGENSSMGNEEVSTIEILDLLNQQKVHFLAMKYLKNVSMGDKRIIVVNGKIMGASLRTPKPGSWICNVSMGGKSNLAEVEPEEIEIVKKINPLLSENGIVMYGVDTLMDDHGKRVLSEINTASIGGLPQIAKLSDKPLVEEAIELILSFAKTKMQNERNQYH